MSDIKISVIIPVYNVEKTLHRCIDSILNQTLKEIEIILVNDGSPDRCGMICDEYASKYNNIYVIHKENEGLGPTRNAGAAIAKGEYIYHCDSDDWVDDTLLEDSYISAEKNNADAVIFGYRMFTENYGILKEYGIISSADEEYTDGNEIKEFFISNLKNAYLAQSACNRIIRREFLDKHNLQFKPFRRSQDVIFSLDLFDKLEKLNVISRSYYNYIIEPGKFKGRSFDEMIGIYLDVYMEIRNYFLKWDKLYKNNELLLGYLYIGHISNYASFYIIKKANNKINKVLELVDDTRIQELFQSIQKKDIKSRFLKLTHFAITRRKPVFLLLVFLLHEMKVSINK